MFVLYHRLCQRLHGPMMRRHWLLVGACGWVLLILMFVSKFINFSFRMPDGTRHRGDLVMIYIGHYKKLCPMGKRSDSVIYQDSFCVAVYALTLKYIFFLYKMFIYASIVSDVPW